MDVVIPIHSTSRPLERAIRSVTEQVCAARVRITVVGHGLSEADFGGRLPAGIRFITVVDGKRSAAGPMNAGIAAATAEYLCRLDSDDYLEPGALDAWVEHVIRERPDVLLARLRLQGENPMPNPLTRALRSRRLDLVKDRLSYRTNPLGLIRLGVLRDLGLSFTEDLAVGEDLEIGLRLWSSALRVDYASKSPCYVVSDDATDRVTLADRSARVELGATERILRQSWLSNASPATKRSIAVKLLRTHVLDYVTRPGQITLSTGGELDFLRSLMLSMTALSPGFVAPFSRADRMVIDELLDPASTSESLVRAVKRRSSATRYATLLTPRLRNVLDRESTIRRYLGYRLGR